MVVRPVEEKKNWGVRERFGGGASRDKDELNDSCIPGLWQNCGKICDQSTGEISTRKIGDSPIRWTFDYGKLANFRFGIRIFLQRYP